MGNLPNFDHELACYQQGYRRVSGLDEVGRGALAGPVVAAAVILPQQGYPKGINDSKKLSARQRELLYDPILSCALDYGIGQSSAQEIDQINIRQATFLAMQRALQQLKNPADFLLIDGRDPLPVSMSMSTPQQCLVGGDAYCLSIAAASIIAKVYRDRWMMDMNQADPRYDFARHKGYGTQAHRNLIKQHGPSPLHRQSFAGVV